MLYPSSPPSSNQHSAFSTDGRRLYPIPFQGLTPWSCYRSVSWLFPFTLSFSGQNPVPTSVCQTRSLGPGAPSQFHMLPQDGTCILPPGQLPASESIISVGRQGALSWETPDRSSGKTHTLRACEPLWVSGTSRGKWLEVVHSPCEVGKCWPVISQSLETQQRPVLCYLRPAFFSF